MLLNRPAPGDDRGAAMATVIGILAVTGIIAATLMATAVFATATSSATRAAVQAQAAADAGIDFAMANLTAPVCQNGVIRSPTDDPKFTVLVHTRTIQGTKAWTASPVCPAATASHVRLLSTGEAKAPGVVGQDWGDRWTVEAVVKPVPAITARSVHLEKPVSIDAPGSATADMSVASAFDCESGKAVLNQFSTLYLSNKTSTANCLGHVVGDPFDLSSPAYAFPRMTPDDTRWAGRPESLATLVAGWATSPVGSCNYTLSGTRTWGSEPGVRVDSRSTCPGGITMKGQGTVTLNGDVALFVTSFELDGMLTLAGDAHEHALSIVSPWPVDRAGCPQVPPTDIKVLNKGFVTQGSTRVFLYSSNGITVGNDSSGHLLLRGQIAGCAVTLMTPTTLTYAPLSRTMKPAGQLAPMQLVSRRDVR